MSNDEIEDKIEDKKAAHKRTKLLKSHSPPKDNSGVSSTSTLASSSLASSSLASSGSASGAATSGSTSNEESSKKPKIRIKLPHKTSDSRQPQSSEKKQDAGQNNRQNNGQPEPRRTHWQHNGPSDIRRDAGQNAGQNNTRQSGQQRFNKPPHTSDRNHTNFHDRNRPDNRQGGTGSRPDNRTDNRTGTRTGTRTDNRTGTRTGGSTGGRPDNRTGTRTDNRPGTRPGTRPDNRTGGSTGGRPDNRTGGRPNDRPSFDRRGGAPPTTQQPSGKTGRPEGSGEASKRTFKTTRKKQFVNKRKQFFEKEILVNRKKSEPIILANPIPKSISIMESISIADLAKKMNLKASELLSKLMTMGMMANQNSMIDYETAQLLASEYECEIKVISLYEQTLIETPDENLENLEKRPPVVTIMGHVDHGKTTLLDVIRKSNVVDNEQGNITQHIGAYMVDTGHGKISFLDTPGHEAFSLMRARGAKLTDIIVLVVAADDGLMPQTIESIAHAKESKVPIIVALNKMDAPSSNPDRILQQLTEHELIPEEWGGDIPVCRISALKNEGINDLLDHVIIRADLMELKTDNSMFAQGVVLESKIEPGRGIVASVLIQKGTLKKSDNFVVGIYHGKVRDIFDDKGININEAMPSVPVEIIGIEGIPAAGDPFQVTESSKVAKQISIKRQELMRHKEGESIKKVTADTLYESIEKDNTDIVKVIIKGDVHGSVEAIKESLEKIIHDEISVKVIHASAGTINAADILLASTSGALIIGFNVRPNQQVQKLANQERVEIQKYTIIFDVIDSIKKRMEGLLSPDYKEEKIGEVIVREVFDIPKLGIIAGSYVHSGKIEKKSLIKVLRNGKEIHSGKLVSLKRFKDDVNKVETGYECGVGVEGADDLLAEDVLMVYKEVAVAKTL